MYVHKVRMNPIDGWGKNTGLITKVLGSYSTKEEALEMKEKRDKSSDACYCDVGNSWIDE
jgi:hypothetical protein